MVYKSKYAVETNRIGDTRINRRFSWLPFRIGDDFVWLETYEVLQIYSLQEYFTTEKKYTVYNWVDLSYRIIT